MKLRVTLSNIFISIFVLVLAWLIFVNLNITLDYVSKHKIVLDGSISFPGKEFLPLRPFLKDVPITGYKTDYISSKDPDIDRKFAYKFQRAQFALAPTILDHYKPFDYEYTIVCLSPHIKVLNLEDPNLMEVAHSGNIWLIKRIKQ